MANADIRMARNELIVKSNKLIRNARYELSELEQKIIYYLISNVGKEDKEFNWIDLKLKDYCIIANLENTSGNMSHLKKTVKNLADKSWWLKLEDGTELLFRWIDKASIKGNTVNIRLNDDLKPFLLELKQNFTSYPLINTLAIRGKYTPRIYEILKSYAWLKHWKVTIEELRNSISCYTFPQFKEFNRRVIRYSIDEINAYTDIIVEYKTIKDGRTVKAIEFSIKEKEGIEQCIPMLENQQKRLNK